MARSMPPSHPLHRLFHGLTEHTFQTELGIADPRLVDYVSDLLVRFVPSENLFAVRDAQGRRVYQVAEMLAVADRTEGDGARCACHRHVGDVTLFWSGVFPEALGDSKVAARPDEVLVSLQQQGKRSYLLASTYAGEDDEATLLRHLSAQFELCAYGLSGVRREWENLPGSPTRDGSVRPPLLDAG